MKKCTIILLIAAALIFQVAVTGEVNARGRRVDVRFWPGDPTELKCQARGGMQYYPADCEFCFDFGGCSLERYTDYTLVIVPDASSPRDVICLGSDTSSKYGQLHIYDCINTGDLMDAKIMLVLSEDVVCVNGMGELIDYNPERYLFGADNINYEDTGETLDLLNENQYLSGKICYGPEGPEFCYQLEGCGLERCQYYTFVWIKDPANYDQPGSVVCLGCGRADRRGRIKICNCVDLNMDMTDAQVWLLPSRYVNCEDGYLWERPTSEYLIGDGVINYDDTDI